jgi:mersacidin/lichenicidin family type 2 lantibiotic
MNTLDVIRAWKNPDYRASLSADELERLPENPAGVMELDDEQLGMVYGGGSNTGRPPTKPKPPTPTPTPPSRRWRSGRPGLNSRNSRNSRRRR